MNIDLNPRLTRACLKLIEQLSHAKQLPNGKRCWRFQQLLYLIDREYPLGLSYYWYKDGVVVDPETLTKVTGGIIQFIWEDDDCPGCQIERECPCSGNPHNFVTRNPVLKNGA